MTTPYPPGYAFVDGAFCPISEAKISVLDWGFLRSDATYDVVHVWKRRFFRLDRHLARFTRSVASLAMSLPFDEARLVEILSECVRRSGLDDAYVEMILTRGRSATFSRDPRDAVNNFIAFAIPFGWIADETQRKRGLRLHVASTVRIPPSAVDPRVKNYHWLDFVRSLYEAYEAGQETAVLVDGAGHVVEGPGFNIFAFAEGRLTTPASGVLEGITRGTVLELAAELGLEAQTAPLSVSALVAAEEVCITSTAGGIMAVSEIDGGPVGSGAPGPVTSALTDLYWRKHEDPDWTTPVDVDST